MADADEHILKVTVVRAGVVGVACRDEAQPRLVSQPRQTEAQPAIVVPTGALHLNPWVRRAEDIAQLLQRGQGALFISVEQGGGHPPMAAAREAFQSGRVGRKTKAFG